MHVIIEALLLENYFFFHSPCRVLLVLLLPDGYAMLMRPNKAETVVHGCHCPGDKAVRMRKVLARPWIRVRVCHLLLLLSLHK